ncbi:MAG TPA: Nif3-like dinuclear metal center hexameric protein [Chromatiales bacterium]|nr:Nif3-like dinuclear metal center hexameric protein [Chromatiales bacterium]
MVDLDELCRYLDELLDVAAFSDYAPNGLQVEGRREVSIIAAGVTASEAMIQAAIAMRADAILVHHGYFWKGEHPCVTGMKKRRLELLLGNGISLLSYHLPLDAHPRFGNNVVLAGRLGIEVDGPLAPELANGLVLHGRLARPLSPEMFARRIETSLGRAPLHLMGASTSIERVAWCSGAAQSYFEAAAMRGVDAYLTGEVSEQAAHVAAETGTHYFAAGHHATERYGVQALASHLQARFSLTCRYVEIDNPA